MAGLLGNIMPNGFMPAVRNNSDAFLQAGLGLLSGQTGPQQAALGAQGFAAGRQGMRDRQKLNQTVEWLKTVNPELAQAVQMGALNPGDAYKMHLQAQTPKGPTDTMRNLEWRAQNAGLQPGTKEYQDFMASGGKGPLVSINNGGAMPGLGKLSTDYTYKTDAQGNPIIGPDGLPVAAPVPGSPAALEAEQAAKANEMKGVNRASDAITLQDNISKLRDVMDNSQTPVFGTMSRPFALYSGSSAGLARSLLKPITSGVALDAMMRLKEASKQGATGFGAMNEKELEILVSKMGALNPDTTDPSIIKDTLDNIQRVIDQVKATVPPEQIKKYGLEPLFAMDGGRTSSGGTTSGGVQWSIE